MINSRAIEDTSCADEPVPSKKLKIDTTTGSSSQILSTLSNDIFKPINESEDKNPLTPDSKKRKWDEFKRPSSSSRLTPSISPTGMMIPRSRILPPTSIIKPKPKKPNEQMLQAPPPIEMKINTMMDIDSELKEPLVLPAQTRNYFVRLGEIASAIGTLDLKNSDNLLALSYGLILIGEIARELLQNHSSYISKKGERHGLTGKGLAPSLQLVLENLVIVRNILADFFIRIDVGYAALVDLGSTIGELALFKHDNGEIKREVTAQINLFAKLKDNIAKKSVDNMHRFSSIISLLNEAMKIKSQSEIDDPVKSFPLCMRYVIIGTCARELVRQEFIPEEQIKLREELDALSEMRNFFAHLNAVYKNTTYFKKQVENLNEAEIIAIIEPEFKLIAKSLYRNFEVQPFFSKMNDFEQAGRAISPLSC